MTDPGLDSVSKILNFSYHTDLYLLLWVFPVKQNGSSVVVIYAPLGCMDPDVSAVLRVLAFVVPR